MKNHCRLHTVIVLEVALLSFACSSPPKRPTRPAPLKPTVRRRRGPCLRHSRTAALSGTFVLQLSDDTYLYTGVIDLE